MDKMNLFKTALACAMVMLLPGLPAQAADRPAAGPAFTDLPAAPSGGRDARRAGKPRDLRHRQGQVEHGAARREAIGKFRDDKVIDHSVIVKSHDDKVIDQRREKLRDRRERWIANHPDARPRDGARGEAIEGDRRGAGVASAPGPRPGLHRELELRRDNTPKRGDARAERQRREMRHESRPQRDTRSRGVPGRAQDQRRSHGAGAAGQGRRQHPQPAPGRP